METFYPTTEWFIRSSDEQALGAIIPNTGGYVAVGRKDRDKTSENILGCKTRTPNNCKECVALGIAEKIKCTKPLTREVSI